MFSSYPAGILSVTIIEARKLHGEDFMGKNDPYAEIYINDDYKQCTRVIENNNNPVWNETFTFNLSESRKHKFTINVLDKDMIGSDEIGDCKFDYEEAFNGVPIDTWVKLPTKMGLSNHGEVHIYVQFTPA